MSEVNITEGVASVANGEILITTEDPVQNLTGASAFFCITNTTGDLTGFGRVVSGDGNTLTLAQPWRFPDVFNGRFSLFNTLEGLADLMRRLEKIKDLAIENEGFITDLTQVISDLFTSEAAEITITLADGTQVQAVPYQYLSLQSQQLITQLEGYAQDFEQLELDVSQLQATVDSIQTDLDNLVLAAENARDAAQLAQGLSEDARDLSQKWANEAEDIEVELGEFSSLHWAKKSEASAASITTDVQEAEAARDLAEKWASEVEDVEVEAGKFSSLHYSLKSDGSSQLSQRWANEAVDVIVEGAEYSAKHYSIKAKDEADRAESYADVLEGLEDATTYSINLLSNADADAWRTSLNVLEAGTADAQVRTNLQNDGRFAQLDGGNWGDLGLDELGYGGDAPILPNLSAFDSVPKTQFMAASSSAETPFSRSGVGLNIKLAGFDAFGQCWITTDGFMEYRGADGVGAIFPVRRVWDDNNLPDPARLNEANNFTQDVTIGEGASGGVTLSFKRPEFGGRFQLAMGSTGTCQLLARGSQDEITNRLDLRQDGSAQFFNDVQVDENLTVGGTINGGALLNGVLAVGLSIHSTLNTGLVAVGATVSGSSISGGAPGTWRNVHTGTITTSVAGTLQRIS